MGYINIITVAQIRNPVIEFFNFVQINDKHIEVIVSQMLRKVEVTQPGETTLLVGEQLDADEFEKNKKRYSQSRGKVL